MLFRTGATGFSGSVLAKTCSALTLGIPFAMSFAPPVVSVPGTIWNVGTGLTSLVLHLITPLGFGTNLISFGSRILMVLPSIPFAYSCLRTLERRVGSDSVAVCYGSTLLISSILISLISPIIFPKSLSLILPLTQLISWSWILPSFLFCLRYIPDTYSSDVDKKSYPISSSHFVVQFVALFWLLSPLTVFSPTNTHLYESICHLWTPPLMVTFSYYIVDYVLFYRRLLYANGEPDTKDSKVTLLTKVLDYLTFNLKPLTGTFLTRNFLVYGILYKKLLVPLFIGSNDPSEIKPHDLYTREEYERKRQLELARKNAQLLSRRFANSNRNIIQNPGQQMLLNQLEGLRRRAITEDDPQTAINQGINTNNDIPQDENIIDESLVEQLTTMGFEADKARDALRRSNGRGIEAAIALLI